MSLNRGIFFTPLLIKEKGNYPLKFFEIKIPLLGERIGRILAGDEPRRMLLLDYIRSIEHIATHIARIGGNVVYAHWDRVFVLWEEGAEYKESLYKKLQEILSKMFSFRRFVFREFEMRDLPFVPIQVKIDKEKEITLLKITGKERDSSRPLRFIPFDFQKIQIAMMFTGLYLFEDAFYFLIDIDFNKKQFKKTVNFIKRLAEEDAFVHIVPVMEDNILRVQGAFTEPFPIIKHRVKSIVNTFSSLADSPDYRIFLGKSNIVAGIVKLNNLMVPLFMSRVPTEQINEAIVLDEGILQEVYPYKVFEIHHVPFIGRLEQLEVFERFVYEKRDEQTPVYINVSGLPGVGKSRFVDEAFSIINERWDNVEIIKIDLARAGSDDIYASLSITAKVLGISIDKKRPDINKLRELIRERLKELAQNAKVFIVFENIDTLGKDAVKFLSGIFLADRLSGVYVVTTSREKLSLPYVKRERCLHIQLGPLSKESLKYLVLELLGAFPTHSFLEFIYDNTQGIPLYVIELVLRLKARGKIFQKRNYYDLLQLQDEKVETLEDIVYEFYSGYRADGIKTLIDACAVYPGDIPVYVLEKLYSRLVPRKKFEDAFKKLISTFIVEIKTHENLFPGIAIGFKNEIFRKIVLEKITKTRISRLRRAILEVLEHDRRIPEIIRYRTLAEIAKALGDREKIALYMWNYAKEHNRLSSFDTAYRALVEIEEFGPEFIEPLKFHTLFAKIGVQTGNFKKALEHFKRAFYIADENEKKSLQPLGAVIYAALGKIEEANRYLENINPEEYKGIDRGYAYNAIGICNLRKEKNKEAEEYLLLAGKYIENKNTALYLAVLSNLSVAQQRMCKYHKALSTMEEALRRAQRMYDSYYLMAIQHNRAILFTHIGKYEEATRALEESAFWAEQMGLIHALSFIYNTRGMLLFELGKYRDALNDLEKAYNNVLKTDDKRQRASILANMGFARTKIGEWRKAKEELFESTSIREEINDLKGLSNNLFYMGELMREWEHFKSAVSYFEKSITLKEEIGDKMGLLYAHGYFSLLYSDMKKFDKAYKMAKKGLKIADSLEDPHGNLLLEVAILSSLIGLSRWKEVENSLGSLKSKLSERQFFHLESFVYYLEGIFHEKTRNEELALSSYLKALEKTKITGEIKIRASVVERILWLMVTYQLKKFGLEYVIEDANEILHFYNENGLGNKARDLSLMLSEL